jgi:DNA-binding Lrp family transcriptional regulator
MRAIHVPKALVCINTDIFSAQEVLEEVRACEGVEEAFRVHGVYDIVAKISGETSESLLDIVTRKIERLQSVQTLHVMLIIEQPEKPAQENSLIIA